jgi:hypothetical protein
VTEESATKACPFCAETILAAAIKCKHCGSDLSTHDPNQKAPINPFPLQGPIARKVPSKRQKMLAVLGVIFAIAFCVWFYFTPYLTVNSLVKAAKANKPEIMSDYINFPSVKESIKANLNASLAGSMTKDAGTNPFAGLAVMMAAAFVDKMVDAFITPEGLSTLMKGQKPDFDKKAAPAAKGEDDSITDGKYESFDRFVFSVHDKNSSDSPVGFVFDRDGLFSWKLSAIRFVANSNASQNSADATPAQGGNGNPLQGPQESTKDANASPTNVQGNLPTDIRNGMSPVEVLELPSVGPRFVSLVGNKIGTLKANLAVSSGVSDVENYFVGAGCAAHQCTVDEAVFSIDKRTGALVTVLLEDGKTFRFFGVSGAAELPAPLKTWYSEHGGE